MEHLSGLYLCNVFPSRWILLNEYSERFYNNMDIQIYIHNIIFMKIVTMMMMTDVFLSQTSLGNLAETLLQSSFIFSPQKKTSKKKDKTKNGKKRRNSSRQEFDEWIPSVIHQHTSLLAFSFLYEEIRLYISVRNGRKGIKLSKSVR